ncbi:phosphotransferase [Edaphobacter dinghuensis]|uniref:phosphotransferase n=1 Tax=Edaphobacter dinghuensis TaxID=1560005 RepID=UPI0021E0A4AD|nr:phosphotransferase [Edaphobacter dinghuensis]
MKHAIDTVRGTTKESGPFSRFGWTAVFHEWLKTAVGPDEPMAFRQEFRQLNASPKSVLLRIRKRDGSLLWFKACDPIFSKERKVACALAALFPEHLPSIIAEHEAWNGWLMRDAGLPLDSIRGMREANPVRLMQTVGALQAKSIEYTASLIDAGCIDLRSPHLYKCFRNLLPALTEIVQAQIHQTPRRVRASDLHRIVDVLERTCQLLDEYGMPDGLVHGDLRPDNILVSDEQFVLVDWASAVIGPPFMAFEEIAMHPLLSSSSRASVLKLKSAYGQQWRGILSEKEIDLSFSIGPFMGSAMKICLLEPLLKTSYRLKPQFERHVRSLIRRLMSASTALNEKYRMSA